MKKKEGKALIEKLIVAVKKVLEDNNAKLTKGFENIVSKSIRQIVKKSSKKIVLIKKPD